MNQFEISDLARLSGMPVNTLRAWETRYSTVQPIRASSGERRYRFAEARRVTLLAEAVRSGSRIGEVAKLSVDALASLMHKRRGKWAPTLEEVESICSAVVLGKIEALGELLDASLARRTPAEFVDHVVRLCTIRLGQTTCGTASRLSERLWVGALTKTLQSAPPPRRGVRADLQVFTATVGSEEHVVGALTAAMIARACGASAIHLGVKVAVEELAELGTLSADAILVLSFVSEVPSHSLGKLLYNLEQTLPSSIHVVIGGRGLERGSLLSETAGRFRQVTSAAEYMDHLLERFAARDSAIETQ